MAKYRKCKKTCKLCIFYFVCVRNHYSILLYGKTLDKLTKTERQQLFSIMIKKEKIGSL